MIFSSTFMAPRPATSRPIRITAVLAALIVLAGACSTEADVEEGITSEDIEIAEELVAATLSDDESGVMNAAYDVFSSIDGEGIRYAPAPRPGNGGPRSAGIDAGSGSASQFNGRGNERNFAHTYDSLTGIHTIAFERSITTPVFNKSIVHLQTFLYKDLEGAFIARPRAERERVESVDYTGSISGSTTFNGNTSNFSRIDTMKVTGAHATSATLSLDGSHSSVGYRSMPRSSTRRDRVNRPYAVELSFEDIVVDKAAVEAFDTLEEAITGTITYKLTFDQDGEDRVVEGTIDLEGDGTAVLRFKGLTRWIRFGLATGERVGSGS
jgi:hypothetical protein